MPIRIAVRLWAPAMQRRWRRSNEQARSQRCDPARCRRCRPATPSSGVIANTPAWPRAHDIRRCEKPGTTSLPWRGQQTAFAQRLGGNRQRPTFCAAPIAWPGSRGTELPGTRRAKGHQACVSGGRAIAPAHSQRARLDPDRISAIAKEASARAVQGRSADMHFPEQRSHAVVAGKLSNPETRAVPQDS